MGSGHQGCRTQDRIKAPCQWLRIFAWNGHWIHWADARRGSMSGSLSGFDLAPKRIQIGDIELHYIEKGRGDPLVLLHGGIHDYRSWLLHLDSFASAYHVIAYSRRYNFPNANGRAAPITRQVRTPKI